jgi:3-deoxy-manno-octulosonate cytidylyltransferase (CMP-KDO synthetase)
MPYTVLIPARLASVRLPDKPLADIAGVPMVVRVAQQAARAGGALRVVVAADDERIMAACARHGVQAVLTRTDHPSGSDRLAEACVLLGLEEDDVVVNVQGDEPLVPPELIEHCAALLLQRPECVMATVAHPLHSVAEWRNPNVVKVVLDAAQRALCFTRAPVPHWRDGPPETLPSDPAALRHLGLYAYRAGFLRAFPTLTPAPLERTEALEQLRVLWHGHRIAVHLATDAPATGVDTPEDLARVRALFAAGNPAGR